MKFAIYQLKDGQITSTAACQSREQLTHQITLGVHAVLEVGANVSGHTHRIEQGRAVPITTASSSAHVFDHSTQAWVDPRSLSELWALVRSQRDQRLSQCDWTQLPDVPLSTKEVWVTYRQALRDITSQDDPHNIEWPSPPDVAQAAALALASETPTKSALSL
jgi:hypothetical protein